MQNATCSFTAAAAARATAKRKKKSFLHWHTNTWWPLYSPTYVYVYVRVCVALPTQYLLPPHTHLRGFSIHAGGGATCAEGRCEEETGTGECVRYWSRGRRRIQATTVNFHSFPTTTPRFLCSTPEATIVARDAKGTGKASHVYIAYPQDGVLAKKNM